MVPHQYVSLHRPQASHPELIMHAPKPLALLTSAIFVGIAGCHHSQPEVAPAPVTQSSAPAPSGPSASDTRGDSLANAERDRNAREEAARAVAAARAALLQKVYFDFDVSEIRADQQPVVDAKVPVLSANTDVRIRVAGHADERGSAEYNMALGMRRAAAVKRLLENRGIDANRIDLVSYGEERPVCTGHDEDCWRQNRRDEFEIIAGDVRR
jgi:peptidoglycan-associated lipoprotein